jgi:transcription elongation factor GreA
VNESKNSGFGGTRGHFCLPATLHGLICPPTENVAQTARLPGPGVFDTFRRHDYHSQPVGTSGARLGCGSPGVLSFTKAVKRGQPRPTTCIAGAQPTVNNKPTYLSKDGLEKLRAELDEMVSVKRPEVANRIHDAKEHGDLSENAEYEDAKNEQAFVEGRIQTLEALIKNATIIDENHSTDHVQIGSTVAVESPDGKEAFTIVGSAEAKPAEGRISNESPVGRALLGKKKGEKVVVKVPAGDFTYKIVGIT